MLFKRDVNLFWFVSFICTNILQVLAISEGLHDVYSLGKEAATAHAALMEDLSKVYHLLLKLMLEFFSCIANIIVNYKCISL